MRHWILALMLFQISWLGCEDDAPPADPRPVCGDGRVEAPETCDGTDLQGMSCTDLGFTGGALLCGADCTIDTVECSNTISCEQVVDPCETSGATRCVEGARSSCTADADACLSWGANFPCASGTCADETDCAPEVVDGGPIWLVHVSDLHFGKGNNVATTYAYLLSTVVPAIHPTATFQTGDMVDDGDVEPHWLEYDTSWRGLADEPPVYLEIAGNHDVKGDGESYWLTHTPTGAWDPELFGVTGLSTALGGVEVVRTNTSSGSINVQNTNGYFSEDQANALLALTPAADAVFRVLLAHHPTVGLLFLTIGRDRMRSVMAHFGSEVYLCGHLHSANITWDGSVLLVQASEFGEDTTFTLVAKDGDDLSSRELPITGPWVMITSPGDPNLGGDNPRARSFTVGSVLPVRALGFALNDDLTLSVQLDAGDWLPMTQTSAGVWEADVTLPALADTRRLTVRASSSEGSSEHTIDVIVQ
ncbi:MAG: hypothetical protein CVU65_04130 [Deltaproteobacteria bacterium HGW-Deltaproteobacteria-22]|nr:MAG: hypothetical protein CVU65_04130 [Deltaproteobacteria bacterium HGW-Deltaproteobacteria-22]